MLPDELDSSYAQEELSSNALHGLKLLRSKFGGAHKPSKSLLKAAANGDPRLVPLAKGKPDISVGSRRRMEAGQLMAERIMAHQQSNGKHSKPHPADRTETASLKNTNTGDSSGEGSTGCRQTVFDEEIKQKTGIPGVGSFLVRESFEALNSTPGFTNHAKGMLREKGHSFSKQPTGRGPMVVSNNPNDAGAFARIDDKKEDPRDLQPLSPAVKRLGGSTKRPWQHEDAYETETPSPLHYQLFHDWTKLSSHGIDKGRSQDINLSSSFVLSKSDADVPNTVQPTSSFRIQHGPSTTLQMDESEVSKNSLKNTLHQSQSSPKRTHCTDGNGHQNDAPLKIEDLAEESRRYAGVEMEDEIELDGCSETSEVTLNSKHRRMGQHSRIGVGISSNVWNTWRSAAMIEEGKLPPGKQAFQVHKREFSWSQKRPKSAYSFSRAKQSRTGLNSHQLSTPGPNSYQQLTDWSKKSTIIVGDKDDTTAERKTKKISRALCPGFGPGFYAKNSDQQLAINAASRPSSKMFAGASFASMTGREGNELQHLRLNAKRQTGVGLNAEEAFATSKSDGNFSRQAGISRVKLMDARTDKKHRPRNIPRRTRFVGDVQVDWIEGAVQENLEQCFRDPLKDSDVQDIIDWMNFDGLASPIESDTEPQSPNESSPKRLDKRESFKTRVKKIGKKKDKAWVGAHEFAMQRAIEHIKDLKTEMIQDGVFDSFVRPDMVGLHNAILLDDKQRLYTIHSMTNFNAIIQVFAEGLHTIHDVKMVWRPCTKIPGLQCPYKHLHDVLAQPPAEGKYNHEERSTGTFGCGELFIDDWLSVSDRKCGQFSFGMPARVDIQVQLPVAGPYNDFAFIGGVCEVEDMSNQALNSADDIMVNGGLRLTQKGACRSVVVQMSTESALQLVGCTIRFRPMEAVNEVQSGTDEMQSHTVLKNAGDPRSIKASKANSKGISVRKL